MKNLRTLASSHVHMNTKVVIVIGVITSKMWRAVRPVIVVSLPFSAATLMQQITKDFGSFDEMKKKLSESTVAIQGSGWGWLGFEPATKRLRIATCANQDPLQATTGLVPLFGIDVWEHAYYLQYKNVRPDYVKAIFDIINWNDVSARYKKAASC